MEVYIDMDGYVCFQDGEIFWTLHRAGWEVFAPNSDIPFWETGNKTFPTGEELEDARDYYENIGKSK